MVFDSDHLALWADVRFPQPIWDELEQLHTEDGPRYRHAIGRKVRLPIVGREIPVIADAYVDPTFGTGVVKITPAPTTAFPWLSATRTAGAIGTAVFVRATWPSPAKIVTTDGSS